MLVAAAAGKLNVDAKSERYVSVRIVVAAPNYYKPPQYVHLAHEIAAARFLNYFLRKC